MNSARFLCGLPGVFLCSLLSIAALAEEGVLRRGNSGEPATLDPHRSSNSFEQVIINDLFMGLMTFGPAGEVIPGAAESFDISEDGQVWTFHLREGMTWSDGVPITSQDFIYSLRRSMDPATASPAAATLFAILNARQISTGELPPESLGVTAPDDRTVIFELEEPVPYFDKLLATTAALPVPRHVIEAHGRLWSRPENTASNGPFVLSEWRPKVHVKAARNPTFYDANNVALKGITYLPTEDLGTQLRRFRSGDIDIGLNFPPSQYDWIQKNLGPSLRIFPILGTYYYAINTKTPQLSGASVRRALAMAIDRSLITDRLLRTGERPAHTLVPPGFDAYPELPVLDYTALSMDERRAEAVRLLGEAGFTAAEPLTLELHYNMTEEHRSVAVAVAGMLQTIGVKVSLLNTEMRAHFKDLSIGNYEVGRAAKFAAYDDPTAFLSLFASDNRADNYAQYVNPEFDDLLVQANRAFDVDERAALLRQAELLAFADQPIIPIYYYVSKRLVSPRVKGWRDNPRGTHPGRYLSVDSK